LGYLHIAIFPLHYFAMTLSLLSNGVLQQIMVKNATPDGPVLQIVQIREVTAKANTPKRYRVALNDGRHYASAMCSQAMNTEIANDVVRVHHIIRLTRYAVNASTGKKVIVIMEFDVVSTAATDLLGSPSPLRDIDAPDPAHPTPREDPKPRQTIAPARPPTSANFVSIAALTSYMGSNWTIQAKIIHKSQMSSWSKPQSEGNFSSVTLKDKTGTEIRGTFFKADADKWYPLVELDKVYTVTGGRVKNANRRYTTVANDYEISFDSNTRFEEVVDDGLIGGRAYKFVDSLRDVEALKEHTMVDVVAVIKEVEEAVDVTTKRGASHRRRILLCDSSRIQMELTLWDKEALNFSCDAVGRVVQIKDARVNDFHGKQLGTTNATMIQIGATESKARELEHWWANGGAKETFESASNSGDGGNCFGYLSVINERRLGTNKDLPDYFTFFGHVTEVVFSPGRLLYYNACAAPACKNCKIEEHGEIMICKKCGIQVTTPKERFAFLFRAADFTGSGYTGCLILSRNLRLALGS
jgi:replication factor A1